MNDAIRITKLPDGNFFIEGPSTEPLTAERLDALQQVVGSMAEQLQPIQPIGSTIPEALGDWSSEISATLREMGLKSEFEKTILNCLIHLHPGARLEAVQKLPATFPDWFQLNVGRKRCARCGELEYAHGKKDHAFEPEAPLRIETAPPTIVPEPEPLPWKDRLNALTLQKNPEGDFVLTGPNAYKIIPLAETMTGDRLFDEFLAVVGQLKSEPDDETTDFTPIPLRLENQAEMLQHDELRNWKDYEEKMSSLLRDAQAGGPGMTVRFGRGQIGLGIFHDRKTSETGIYFCDIEEPMPIGVVPEERRYRPDTAFLHMVFGNDESAGTVIEMIEYYRQRVHGRKPMAEQLHEIEVALMEAEGQKAHLAILALPYRIGLLGEELTRFREGKLTADEIQNLCHNVPMTVSAEDFCAGCEKYQARLYGRSPITELRTLLLHADATILRMNNAAGHIRGMADKPDVTDAIQGWAIDIKNLFDEFDSIRQRVKAHTDSDALREYRKPAMDLLREFATDRWAPSINDKAREMLRHYGENE